MLAHVVRVQVRQARLQVPLGGLQQPRPQGIGDGARQGPPAPGAAEVQPVQVGGSWKIIDVYYGAISQLTTRRSDFAGPVASGGAAGLVTHLNQLTDKLLA